MSSTTLFPDEAFLIQPARDRLEPTIWVRRLVILPTLAPGVDPIRDISLRPGLNLIRTEDRPEGDTRVIGHSVGKTLFTRLLRYCLGESHFAIEAVRSRILAKRPDAWVLAEVRVECQTWSVARPFQDAAAGDSRATLAEDCMTLANEGKPAPGFAEFMRCADNATTGRVPDIPLPISGRPVRWLDMLGWLARDHECRYRVYNEWREPDAGSGTGKLVRDDASFLLRLVMGLVSAEESPLIAEHRKLLAKLDEIRKQIGQLSQFIDSTFPLLRSRLGLSEDETGDDKKLVGGLFTTKAREVVNAKVQSLRRLSRDVRSSSKVKQLYEGSLSAASALAVLQADLKRTTGLRTQAENQLAQRESSSAAEYYASWHPYRHCPKADCPFKPENRLSDEPDPEREAEIVRLRQDFARYTGDIERLDKEISRLQQACKEAKNGYVQEQKRSNRSVRGISREIGRWNLLSEQADEYESSLRDLARAEKRLVRTERAYQKSLQTLEATRRQQARRRRQASRYFDWTLKHLLGPNAGGAVVIDAKGLHPAPNNSVAANGAALSTLATVLGLDLACMTASVCGLGHHPRLVIHDSPHEAELESVLFARIFHLVGDLEAAFGDGREPSFQYIVTTASQAPTKFAEKPYARLILDARHEDRLLLKMRF